MSEFPVDISKPSEVVHAHGYDIAKDRARYMKVIHVHGEYVYNSILYNRCSSTEFSLKQLLSYSPPHLVSRSRSYSLRVSRCSFFLELDLLVKQSRCSQLLLQLLRGCSSMRRAIVMTRGIVLIAELHPSSLRLPEDQDHGLR